MSIEDITRTVVADHRPGASKHTVSTSLTATHWTEHLAVAPQVRAISTLPSPYSASDQWMAPGMPLARGPYRVQPVIAVSWVISQCPS